MVGDPVIDSVTGLPQIEIREGVPEVVRGVPLVETMARQRGGHHARAAAWARSSTARR